MLSNWMLVALGGALGAVLRFYISESMPDADFPWATLSVNLVGSLLLGAVTAATLSNALSEPQALLLGVGLLGVFTTMSVLCGNHHTDGSRPVAPCRDVRGGERCDRPTPGMVGLERRTSRLLTFTSKWPACD